MEIKVDKNVPLPEPYSRCGRQGKYPWQQMSVGDSFAIRYVDKTTRDRFASAAGYYAKRHGRKHTIRDIPSENGVRVLRVWRVA